MRDERIQVGVAVLLLLFGSLCAGCCGGGAARPERAPGALKAGQSLTLSFPELAPHLARMAGKGAPAPQMTIALPENYRRDRLHPLLIYLGGGAGGNGGTAAPGPAITEGRDFVCARMPLFKESIAPLNDRNRWSRLFIDNDDADVIWKAYRVMLQKLHAVVPNVDPSHSAMGGFSNGANTAAVLLNTRPAELLEHVRAFFFIEGGGHLEQYEALSGRPLLLLQGEESGRWLTRVRDRAREAGAEVHHALMPGVGHGFPAPERVRLRRWLRQSVLERPTEE